MVEAHNKEILLDPILSGLGVEHGFGTRTSHAPDSTHFPKQVHGTGVARVGPSASADEAIPMTEADAILTDRAGACIGIVTADCVPILGAASDGRCVVAIHAGWRGLAAGVIEAGISALSKAAGAGPIGLAIGPAARGCCYEVDEPVHAALRERYSAHLDEVLLPSRRAGHFQLDLPLLAERVAIGAGVAPERIGTAQRRCTVCDPDLFESYRRDGAQAGRLRHFIRARGADCDEG